MNENVIKMARLMVGCIDRRFNKPINWNAIYNAEAEARLKELQGEQQ